MIPAATLEFLRELAAHNEKPWFEANRARYESALKAPIAAMVTAVSAELERRDLPLTGDPKRSAFRIHRDVRFSGDKRPYKTTAGIVWFRQGSSKGGAGVLYLHLDPAGCFAAAAFYHPEPEDLDSIRERIRVHPSAFLEMEAGLAASGLSLSEAEMLTRMPKGFEDLKGSAVERAIRLKSFVARRAFPARVVHGAKFPAVVATLAADALPLLRFGWAAVDEGRAAA